ncbi:hypothetical protein ABEB36_014814 [Hypothenemus hampei]|uniref:NACHT domain-containing protein n=1 Tax=Hypothenemus hampei TaxID=57062 RepID=A0ABD1E0X5_HYPHA
MINAKDKSEVTRWLHFPNDQKQRQFEENCKKNKIHFVTSQGDLEAFFGELTVHWLKFVRDQLIWCRTRGSLENLKQYRDKGYRTFKPLIGEDDLIKEIKHKKVSIIAGDPGMGKTTTLVKLYGLKYELQSGVEESIIGNSNLETEAANKIIEFLSQVDDSPCDNFARSLLGMALINEHFTKPLLIAFDGFDEVLNEADRDKIISLLSLLKDLSFKRLRPNFGLLLVSIMNRL